MIKNILRSTKRYFRHTAMCVHFIRNSNTFTQQESYSNLNQRKKNSNIIIDNLLHIFRYGEVNRFYFAYGLDQQGSISNDYIAYNEFMHKRNKMNYTRPFDYLCVLRDKYLFNIVAKSYNIPVPKDFGVVKNGFVVKEGKTLNIDDMMKGREWTGRPLFFKAISGECGESVFKVVKNSDNNYQINNNQYDSIQSFFQQNIGGGSKCTVYYSRRPHTTS